MVFPLDSIEQQVEARTQTLMQNQAKLQAECDRYRSILDLQTTLICRFLPNGTLTFVNRAYCQQMGYSEAELLGQNLIDLVPDRCRNLRQEQLTELQALTPDDPIRVHEHLAKTPKGYKALQQWTSTGIFDQAKELIEIQSVGHDITEAHFISTAISEQQQYLDSILSSIDGVVWSIQPKTWRVLYLNAAAERLYGHPTEDFFTDPTLWRKVVHPDDRAIVADCMRQLKTQPRIRYEYRIICPDGQVRWLQGQAHFVYDAAGEPIRIDGIATDITDRKQVEQVLEAERSLFVGGPTMIFKWRPTEGWPVEYVSPNVRSQLGYSSEDFLSEHVSFAALIHPEDYPGIALDVQTRLDNQEAYFSQEYRLRHANGEYCWVYDFTRVIYTAEGKVAQLLGYLQDTSDRKAIELALLDTQEHLQALLKGSPAVIFAIGAEPPHSIRFISDNITQICGYDPAVVLQNPGWWHDNIHPDDFPTVAQSFDAWIANGASGYITLPFRFRKADSTWIWADARTTAIRDSEHRILELVTTVIDVTAQVESDRRLEQIARNLPGFIYEYRLRPDGTSHFPYASPGIFNVFGLPPSAVQEDAAAVFEQIHPGDRDRVAQSITDSAETLTTWQCEYRVSRPNGVPMWLAAQATPQREADGSILWQGYTRDITDLKRVEAALQQSETTQRAMLEAIPDLLIRVNRDGIRLNLISGGDVKLLQSVNRNRQQSIYDTLPKPLADKRMYFIKQALETGTRQIYEQAIEVEHELRYEETRVVPLDADEVLIMVRDVTDRVMAELALRESEARWQFALSGSGDGVWDWNAQTNKVFFSPQWKKMLGYKEHEIGDALEEWDARIHPDDKAQCYADLERHFRGETPIYQNEHRMCCKDGSYKWILDRGKVIEWLEAGKPLRVIGTHTDISDRKRTESELELQRAFLRQVIDVVPNVIGVKDAEGRILVANKAGAAMHGTTVEAMIGKREIDFNPNFSAEQLEEVLAVNRQVLQTGEAMKIASQAIVDSNGETHWYQTVINPFRDSAGHISGVVGAMTDITEIKQTELALQQAKEVAETANQAKSLFLANMSHELRTPLNVILGFTQVIRRDPLFSSEHQETIQIIHRSGEHLLHLINDILDLSKIEAGQATLEENSFDLFALVNSVEEMLRQPAESKGLQFQVALEPEVPQYITADSNKLRQVLINLLSNAIKFTDQGKVTVRVKRGDKAASSDEKFETYENNASDREALVLEVEDSGIGIADDEVETIFKAFTQSRAGKVTPGGTGLGLTISRHFVELMRGKISVHSTLGQGSLFQVQIPVQLAQPNHLSVPKSQRQVVGLTPGQPLYRILVVDDRLENRLILVKLLAQVGLEVREAENGQEAIAQWQQWRPHLIWMDIRMPIIDGYEATRQIRELEQSLGDDQATVTKIIALTAQASMSDRTLTLVSGCDDFVSKPFRAGMLYEKLAEHLGISFIYADNPLDARTGDRNLTPESLAVMSPDWIRALYHAAQLGDEEEVEQVLQHIPEDFADLAHQLSRLAYNYQFTQIKQLCKPHCPEPPPSL